MRDTQNGITPGPVLATLDLVAFIKKHESIVPRNVSRDQTVSPILGKFVIAYERYIWLRCERVLNYLRTPDEASDAERSDSKTELNLLFPRRKSVRRRYDDYAISRITFRSKECEGFGGLASTRYRKVCGR